MRHGADDPRQLELTLLFARRDFYSSGSLASVTERSAMTSFPGTDFGNSCTWDVAHHLQVYKLRMAVISTGGSGI